MKCKCRCNRKKEKHENLDTYNHFKENFQFPKVCFACQEEADAYQPLYKDKEGNILAHLGPCRVAVFNESKTRYRVLDSQPEGIFFEATQERVWIAKECKIVDLGFQERTPPLKIRISDNGQVFIGNKKPCYSV